VGVPLIHFGTGAGHLLPALREAGGDVIGLDWRLPLDEGWRRVGATSRSRGTSIRRCCWVLANACCPRVDDVLSRRVEGGPYLQPGPRRPTDDAVENVKAVVDHVHARNAR
jgi:uroporphyrinogen decarboxylase